MINLYLLPCIPGEEKSFLLQVIVEPLLNLLQKHIGSLQSLQHVGLGCSYQHSGVFYLQTQAGATTWLL